MNTDAQAQQSDADPSARRTARHLGAIREGSFSEQTAMPVLPDMPIRASWILEGEPKARCKMLSGGSTDQSAVTIMWDCTAGRFNWFYDVDETVYVLEGSVTLTLPSGEIHRLVAGSTYFFARDTQAQWHVERYIRKVAFCHAPMSAKLRLVKRLYMTLKHLVRPGSPAEGGPAKMFEAT